MSIKLIVQRWNTINRGWVDAFEVQPGTEETAKHYVDLRLKAGYKHRIVSIETLTFYPYDDDEYA